MQGIAHAAESQVMHPHYTVLGLHFRVRWAHNLYRHARKRRLLEAGTTTHQPVNQQ